jgi:hypothetical protein
VENPIFRTTSQADSMGLNQIVLRSAALEQRQIKAVGPGITANGDPDEREEIREEVKATDMSSCCKN